MTVFLEKSHGCNSPGMKPRMSPAPSIKTWQKGDGMEFGSLVASLPDRKSAVYVFDGGKVTKHPFAELAKDVARAVDNLRRWGLHAGSRVGIYAGNCYPWLVYDLAIIKLGAVSVPFTEDFAGKIDRALADQY